MKKIFAAFCLLFALSSSAALLPLLPIGFGLAIVGTAAAGLALPLVGAALVVGAAIGLIALGAPSPTDHQNAPIKVQVNPAEPLPTPSGWTPPVAPATNPSPPASASTQTNHTCQGAQFSGSTPVDACNVYGASFVPPRSVIACTPAAGTINRFDCAMKITSTGAPVGSVGTLPVTACPAGYVESGPSCVVSNPSQVVKPSDGQCQIIRVGNSFSGDPQDPDCAVNNIPNSVSITGGQITVRPSSTQTDAVKINPDGSTTVTTTTINNTNNTTTTTTINISSGSGIGTTKITGIGTTTVNGTGDLAGQGPAPSQQLPTDYNRETTQQAIRDKLDQLKQGQCGGLNQPKCALDETGTPSSDTLQPGRDEVTGVMDSRKSQIEQSGDKTSWPSPFSITFPTSAGCTDLQFAIPRSGKTLDLPICAKFAPVRTVIEWMLGIFCAWCIYGIGISAVKGS